LDWEVIWRENWLEIYRFIYWKVNNKQEAEDLTQETFLRAIRSEQRYQDTNVTVIALLKTIARNLMIDKWRINTKNAFSVSLDSELHLESPDKGPEELAQENEEVRSALMLLNEDQRNVIVLRILQGLSIRDTAELLKKSETSVKTIQFRAIEALRKKLHKEQKGVGLNGLP
jgi:RNA polymerase sigma-70 factor (ECF subfamily)